jgi:hypothetical protein
MSPPPSKQQIAVSYSRFTRKETADPTKEDTTPSKKMHTQRKNTHVKLSKIV